ncbi:MAG TPA: M1 family metallopeptidase [Flavobacteriales bacterium]|nr:M1 family metallopeptidase [Flavobacteriales bacterium]HRE98061.1 M1 family metallopeptidase [Flavobacteriales bacterium]HRJ39922.1 M1 family metallopeptidase [Flavobacteriales bacterium]
MSVKHLILLSSTVLLAMCSPKTEEHKSDASTNEDATRIKSKHLNVKDEHSYANIDKVYATHLFLDINLDFDKKLVKGVATYDITNEGGDTIIFDSKFLAIEKIVIDDKTEATFALGEDDELLGTPIFVPISRDAKKVAIHYSTTDHCEALQWLTPEQTAGKKQPYLLTQGEAILTRTWIPIQDTPGNRITYKAKVSAPKDIMVVMSATNPTEKSADGVYNFTMDQPIPSYLIALAAGDLVFKPIGNRTGVYTEPSMLDKCADELADTEKMLEAAERLYGPYKWERYDIIVLPPSFPFGGMENPRLTFATPTIIAGDRSLTSLIAHEMAHSWSGNLVTNATWNDFWLNEGFTVYFERRIMEELYGKEYAEMLAQLGYQDLLNEVEGLAGSPDDTKLKLDLSDRNPDDAMSEIAYEKGAFFLRMLEETAGRVKFDEFLRNYFTEHSFQPMTTEIFLDYLDKNLVKKNNLKVNVDEWVHGRGIPSNISMINSSKFKAVDTEIGRWTTGTPAKDLATKGWSTHEWMHFLKNIPQVLNKNQLKDLDNSFGFTNSGNAEIACLWFQIAINSGYTEANPKIEAFLTSVGRRKFLTPLYKAMIQIPEGKKLANKIYEKARPGYHFVATSTIDRIVGYQEKK